YEICAQQKVATLAINYNEKWVPISSITGKPSTKCPKNTPNLITISYPKPSQDTLYKVTLPKTKKSKAYSLTFSALSK
ncbi:MAG: hypothetical protein ACKOW9_00020, partial [Candidatus Paceibacterota bacterium]